MSDETKIQESDTSTPATKRQWRHRVTEVVHHHLEPADPLRELVHGVAFGVGFSLALGGCVLVGLKLAGVELPSLEE